MYVCIYLHFYNTDFWPETNLLNKMLYENTLISYILAH